MFARVCSFALAVVFVIAASCGNGNDSPGEEVEGTQSGLGAEAEQSQTSSNPAPSSSTTTAAQETPRTSGFRFRGKHISSARTACAPTAANIGSGRVSLIRQRSWFTYQVAGRAGMQRLAKLANAVLSLAQDGSDRKRRFGHSQLDEMHEVSRRNGDSSGGGGIFDFDNPANPLRGWSFVSVPYCTADIFLGDKRTDYGGLVLEHRGLRNATAALDHVIDNFGGR